MFFQLFLLVAFLTLCAAHPGHPDEAVPQTPPPRACGTGPPSPGLVDAHLNLHQQARDARLSKRMTNNALLSVDTYIHFVTTQDQAHKFPNPVLAQIVTNQSRIMNTAYATANITFRIFPYTLTINDAWATDSDDISMKQSLRRGTYSSLNIYFQTNLSTPSSTPSTSSSSMLLGYCTLPTNITYTPCATCAPVEYPPADYVQDGCNVLAGSMPGGNVYGYNEGKTAVHEVGHWFGLLHTFQGLTCDARVGGDFVDDTPQESAQTSGCPTGKDSCPQDLGLDPINNFMDYSSDGCYTGFTPDQELRMNNMFKMLRQGR